MADAPTVGEVVARLDAFAPPALAAEWDNVGLLLGDRSDPASRILTCLTVTPDVVEQALAQRTQLLVTHHPILFRGAKSLSADGADGRLVTALVRAGVAVHSPHTAHDDCPGGVNDQLAAVLGLADVRPLRPRKAPATAAAFKLVVFTPDEGVPAVSDALFAAGAGRIGHYRECSFRTSGVGTFYAEEPANPAVGAKSVREDVPEQRLEAVVPARHLEAVVAAVRRAHRYEEPAIDVYPLAPHPAGGSGRRGVLPNVPTLGELAARLTAGLGIDALQLVGDPARPVRSAAVACGAAGEYLQDAVRAGVDLFVTGELRFHDALAARAAFVSVLVPGHHASERHAMVTLAARMQAWFPAATVAAADETDPFRTVTAST